MKPCKVAVTQCLKQVLPNKITGDGIKKPEHIIVQGYNLCIQSQDCIEGGKKTKSCTSVLPLKHTGNKALQTITADI